jgi:hypothetical protein
MKLKWNWGTGLLLFIILFIGSVAWRIWLANQRDLNLVSEDYYPKGINYQEEINSRKNFDSLGITLPVLQTDDSVKIDFQLFAPPILSANILFYRPSDNKIDKNYSLDSGFSGVKAFAKSDFVKGRYVLKINIYSPQKEYYNETNLNIK